MTVQFPTRIFDVACTPLDACDMRVHATNPGDAKAIAAKSWLDTDMIAFLEEDDFWTVEELYPRKPILY